MNVVGNRKIYFAISGVLVVFSILMLIVKGLNFGIDFTGGTLLERGLPQGVSVGPSARGALKFRFVPAGFER